MKLLEPFEYIISQKKELVELFGFESKNTYQIQNNEKQIVGYCFEQGRGFFSVLVRQILRHWRTFTLLVTDENKNKILTLKHPFRFYFSKLEIIDSNEKTIGSVERKFAFFSKKFEIKDSFGMVIFTINSPLFKIWTFPIKRNNFEVASINKKWGGALKEMFMDADTFQIKINDEIKSDNEKILILASAFYVDILYFEENSGGFGFFDLLDFGS